MSVSFYINETEGPHQVVCSCGKTKGTTIYSSFNEAYVALYHEGTATKPTCEDDYCAGYGFFHVDPITPGPVLNVSNQNALELLDVLGIKVGQDFEERCSGELDGKDLLGRILIAQAVNPSDAGVPVTVQGALVSCGRPAGYVDARLVELTEVAEYAISNQKPVLWS